MPTVAPRILHADALPRWSRYGAMINDYGHNGPGRGDGVLYRDELSRYIDTLQLERNKALVDRAPTVMVDMRLRESKEMLSDMERIGADGLAYLPPELGGLPLTQELKSRVIEMLMTDDAQKTGRISQQVIDAARARYLPLNAIAGGRALAEIGQIADMLRLL